jgi:hypothetical protein
MNLIALPTRFTRTCRRRRVADDGGWNVRPCGSQFERYVAARCQRLGVLDRVRESNGTLSSDSAGLISRNRDVVDEVRAAPHRLFHRPQVVGCPVVAVERQVVIPMIAFNGVRISADHVRTAVATIRPRPAIGDFSS